jgi:dipeptidase E
VPSALQSEHAGGDGRPGEADDEALVTIRHGRLSPVKLYLSSFRMGSDRDALRDLVGRAGRAGRAALVFNACDVYGDNQLRNLEREAEDITSLGFECEELDLRTFFEDFEGLRNRLETYDLLWVVGGNSFVLAKAMTQSRFEQAAFEPLDDGRLVYAGYSAGICVTAPDLEGIGLMDEPDELPDGYPKDVRATTLGWLPWRIVPHWRSQHPEAPLADLAVEHLLHSSLPFRTLRDGQAIVVEGDASRLV